MKILTRTPIPSLRRSKSDRLLGQAAKTAGLSQTDFLRELGRLRIPIHYGMEELEADLLTVGELAG